MKKSMSIVMATVFVAALSLSTVLAFAGDACCAAKGTKAEASGSGSCNAKASASGACTMKSSMASILLSAPGTKMTYMKVDGGAALVITASSKEYVPVVQKAMATRIDEMKMMSSGGHCTMSADKASMATTSGSTCPATGAAMKTADGATCTASASAHCAGGASMTEKTSMECPDWMKVLCGANCQVENTATGVKVSWTTTEKKLVEQVQVAGEKLHADLAS